MFTLEVHWEFNCSSSVVFSWLKQEIFLGRCEHLKLSNLASFNSFFKKNHIQHFLCEICSLSIACNLTSVVDLAFPVFLCGGLSITCVWFPFIQDNEERNYAPTPFLVSSCSKNPDAGTESLAVVAKSCTKIGLRVHWWSINHNLKLTVLE